MLSTDELLRSLSPTAPAHERLGCVPPPDKEELRRRAGTSLDLRLGRWMRTFKPTHHTHARLVNIAGKRPPVLVGSRQHFIRFGRAFTLHPGRFVLASTLEWLQLPMGLSGYITGKSSLGRHGLVIETASGIHPGFSGCLTLEMANVGEIPVQVFPGMLICQVFFHPVSTKQGGRKGEQSNPPAGPQLGKFSGKRRPTISLPSHDGILDALSNDEKATTDEYEAEFEDA